MVVACGVDTPHELKVKNEKLKVESGVKSKNPPPNLVQRCGTWKRYILGQLLVIIVLTPVEQVGNKLGHTICVL